MKTKVLGRTGLRVTENSFGALPIQRVSKEEARDILRYAYERGVNFFDTAHMYTDSEEKIGYALSDVRDKIVIATKSLGRTREAAMSDLNTSLASMKTSYVDIFQLHNIPELPDVCDPDSSFAALKQAQREGKCRFIGITTHRLSVAIEAAESGLYDTVQFPLCYMSSDEDLKLIEICKKHNVGLIAMKGMSGGIISSPRAAFAFMSQYDNLVPIWGCQKKSELDDFLGFAEEGVTMTDKLRKIIAEDRERFKGDFCRSCGYCEPCPVGIPLRDAARMIPLLNRSPWQTYTTPEWQEKMARVTQCLHCGKCSSRCPYQLDTPKLVAEGYEYFVKVCKDHGVWKE